MSSYPRHPYSVALNIANQLVKNLEPYCQRIEVAGSIRRKCETIGDIELVAIPRVDKTIDLFGEVAAKDNLLWNYLDKLLLMEKISRSKPSRWGNIYRVFLFRSSEGRQYKVDLFTCDRDTWGDTLLIRTGAREFSQWMVTRKELNGALPDDMFHLHNKLWQWQEGETIHVPLREEVDWFTICGLPYIEPEYRENNKWLTLI